MSDTIVIKIEDGIQTKAFNENSIIHKDAFYRVTKLIENNLEKAKSYNPTESFKRVHNTITINGERGAGKTSFMLSIKEEYEKNYNEISVLGILDPTLISTRQHVFVLLLSMIEEKINEKYKDKWREKKYDDKFKEWKKSLEILAKGLNQLDGIGINPYVQDLWDDSALVMAKGLSMAKAGIELEKNFHIFVNKSLELIENSAFLLFIDDIDTDFSKGWSVLEVLRKYITTPQIIPIMAGNFELYENLVRNEKSKLFKDLINFESNFESFENKKILYSNQIDELTQQYLMKVLQPINMTNLHKLYYYLIYKNNNIYVKENNKDIFLKDFIKDIFDKLYKFQYPEYLEVITKLSLRTIFQWLYFAKIYKESINTKAFLEANKDIFINNFFNLGINNEFFEVIKTNYSLDEFTNKFVYLISYEDLRELKPNYNNLDLNISIILIPQFLNLQNYLFYKFEYGIKVTLQFYLLELLKSSKNKNIETTLQEKINLLHINKFLTLINRLKNSLKIIINQGINSKLIYQIYKHKDKINIKVLKKFVKDKYNKDNKLITKLEEFESNNDKSKNKNFKNFIKFLEDNEEKKELEEKLKNVSDLNKFIDKLPLFGVKNIKGSQIDYYVSPLKVIALFIDVLKYLENFSDNQNNQQKNLRNILYSYIFEENWIIISDLNTNTQAFEDEYNQEVEILDENYENEINEFINLLEKWYSENQNVISKFIKNLHIIDISKFYYNFYEKIEALRNTCCITVLDYIKVTLVNFINELISLYLLNKKEKTIKQIGSIKSLSSLEKNLNKLDDNNKKYIEVLKKCPIFNIYLESKHTTSLDKILLVQG